MDSLFSLLSTVALKGSLILGIALLGTLALRRASAATRHLLWMAAFVGVAALPVLSFLLPAWRTTVSLPGGPFWFGVDARSAVQAQSGSEFSLWIAGIWVAGAVILLARLLLGNAILFRQSRRAKPIEVEEFPALRREFALARPVTLLEGLPGTMPLIWDLGRAVIFLPPEFHTWPAERRRAVLAHELAHAERRDGISQLLVRVVCSVCWFHPLVWIAARLSLRDCEMACDDRVLSLGLRASDYASHLVDVARSMSSTHYATSAGIAVACRSTLPRRLSAILDSGTRRRMMTRLAVLVALVTAGSFVIPLAALQSEEKKSPRKREDVYRIGGDVKAPRLVFKLEPEYTEEARDARIEGTVVVSLEVTTEGLPENIEIRRSLDPGLDQKAIEAIQRWRFEPGAKDGEPVRVAATVEVNFRLL